MQEKTELSAEEQQHADDLATGLHKMLTEVKRKLKPESKNELIRIIGALLVENYGMKVQLEALRSKGDNETTSTT